MESNSDEMEEMKEHFLDSNQDSSKGGCRTLPFIIVNESIERLGSVGLTSKMILDMRNEYKMEMITGNNILNTWNAAFNFLPVVGPFLSNSFMDRYPMIALGSIFSLLKYVGLKIKKSAPEFAQSALQEIEVLSAITNGDASNSRCVVGLIDRFKHVDPNGQHWCMVLELVGHLALMMELLGKMPRKIIIGGLRSKDYFDRHGDLKRIRRLKYCTLERLLVDKFKLSDADARELAEFLCPILVFAPDKRPTAQQCLQHPWLNTKNLNTD